MASTGLPCSHVTRLPLGADHLGFTLWLKSANVGVPTLAAICVGPVSLPTTARQRRKRSASSPRLVWLQRLITAGENLHKAATASASALPPTATTAMPFCV